MADRQFFRNIATYLLGQVSVGGSFAPNAGSAIVASSNRGKGWSVARTGTGLFTVTFQDTFAKLISATATLQMATALDKFMTVGTYTAASKTLVLAAWDISDGAPGDVAADANNRVNFHCIFSNSGVD